MTLTAQHDDRDVVTFEEERGKQLPELLPLKMSPCQLPSSLCCNLRSISIYDWEHRRTALPQLLDIQSAEKPQGSQQQYPWCLRQAS